MMLQTEDLFLVGPQVIAVVTHQGHTLQPRYLPSESSLQVVLSLETCMVVILHVVKVISIA